MTISQEELERLANNPMRGINLIVNEVEQNWFNGTVQLNSKTHPAVLCMDIILGTSHGFINRVLDATSRIAMRHARTVSELSRNMGDEERYGLFASPSSTVAQMGMNVDTFMELALERTLTVGKASVTYKELLIPKDTTINVNGYDFAISNGIRIQYNERNGWKVVYDGETNSPFQPIGSNVLVRDFKQVDDRLYILINIPVVQLSCKVSENFTVNDASGCRGTITYNDYLYGVRAFLVQNGVMNEVRVSYDQDVFDPLKVTLALDIDTVNNRFNFEIPAVYIDNQRGLGTLRIYTYSTKGELTKNFTQVSPADIPANYQDYRFGAGELDPYSVPFRTAGSIAWQIIEMVTGGQNPVPFNEMKQRVIDGRQQRTTPITENNLKGAVQNYGYNPVKAIDYVTKRAYALTKELPTQANKNMSAPMACFVGSYLASVNDLVASGVVLDNGNRVTIPHNVLFDVSRPTSVLINSITKAQYMGLQGESLVDLTSDRTLVYTPFYYVMDLTNKQAVLRTYHLDGPEVKHQTYKADNPSLGLEVGVGQIAIEHQDDGYLLTMVTKSGSAFKNLEDDQVGIQLSLTPKDSSSLASIAGKLVAYTSDNERVYEFHLASRFDVDVNDVLYFTNFNQFGQIQAATGTDLTAEVTFIFCVTGDKEVTRSTIDDKVNDAVFAEEMVGVLETRYSITFGQLLGNLYSRIRPLVGEAQYKRYEADVPETYLTTEYKRVNGELVFENGEPVVLHQAGDIKYNPDGSVSLLYRRDVDIVYENGKPVELAPRFLKYHWDFIAFDGNYFFSKDDYDKQFAQDTKDYFIRVVSKDMLAFSSEALDRTVLYYQPRSKLGFQQVVINSNYQSILKQDLTFSVTYYLTESGYRNANLRTALEDSTPRQINQALYNTTTVSMADLVASLREDVSAEVVSVKLSALSGDSTVDVISNVDDLTGFSVRKRLVLSSDGLVSVEEAIDVVFLPHDVRMTTTV